MPELPETETIARDLDAEVRGARIARVSVFKPDVLREANVETVGAALRGGTISQVWRRAKLIVIDVATASDPTIATVEALAHLVVQPRFTGGLLLDSGRADTPQADFVAVTLHLADGRLLHYRDVRRLGTVSLMDDRRFAAYSSALGPEPLDDTTDAATFSACVRVGGRSVKAVLMDQRRLAGVGNIYANEALWYAGIDPSRAANTISKREAATLRESLVQVLRASIAARGTSFRDYRDARGQRGSFVEQLAVYGRAGLPCLRCARKLVGTHAVDGRGTVFCAHCQR